MSKHSWIRNVLSKNILSQLWIIVHFWPSLFIFGHFLPFWWFAHHIVCACKLMQHTPHIIMAPNSRNQTLAAPKKCFVLLCTERNYKEDRFYSITKAVAVMKAHLSPVFLWKYCLLITLLPNFLVNFLVIFIYGSI